MLDVVGDGRLPCDSDAGARARRRDRRGARTPKKPPTSRRTGRAARRRCGASRPTRPGRSGAVQLGDPAADVRDFLRLLEKRAMLLERFARLARIRRYHVVEARDAARRRSIAIRCGATRTARDASVLEAQDVEDTSRSGYVPRSRAISFERRVHVLELVPPGLRRGRWSRRARFASCSSVRQKRLRYWRLCGDSSLEVHGDDAAVRRVEGGVDERDGLV